MLLNEKFPSARPSLVSVSLAAESAESAEAGFALGIKGLIC
jgi:hypothetical protein